jgi:hypothetical protein
MVYGETWITAGSLKILRMVGLGVFLEPWLLVPGVATFNLVLGSSRRDRFLNIFPCWSCYA